MTDRSGLTLDKLRKARALLERSHAPSTYTMSGNGKFEDLPREQQELLKKAMRDIDERKRTVEAFMAAQALAELRGPAGDVPRKNNRPSTKGAFGKGKRPRR